MTAMRAVLDTSVLIGAFPAIGLEYELSISSVTYAELETGVVLAETAVDKAERARRLALTRETYGRGVPFDDRAASSFAALVELVRQAGRAHRSRTADLMIAATAHTHGAAVITHNVSDFAGVQDAVTVIDAGGPG